MSSVIGRLAAESYIDEILGFADDAGVSDDTVAAIVSKNHHLPLDEVQYLVATARQRQNSREGVVAK